MTALVAALNGNPITKSSSTGVFISSDFKIHLAYSLIRWRGERAKLGAGTRWRFHGLFYNFQITAVTGFVEFVHRNLHNDPQGLQKTIPKNVQQQKILNKISS